MIVTNDIDNMRLQRWAEPNLTWGLVPTMGYLHEGHLSLVRRAKAENDQVIVSVYVNPTQFGPHEDLNSYPRDLEKDLALLRAEEVDVVFVPDNRGMYPLGFQTTIIVRQVTQRLEGATRPTHFQGVATIVAKLFNIIQPTRAYFGQKDAQQVATLKQMVSDLNFNVQMVICPIVREADGLALSSRNKYLSMAERQAATVLNRALTAAYEAYLKGNHDGVALRQLMTAIINAEPLARLDYVSASNPQTFQETSQIEGDLLLATAVYFGKTRLIDNIMVTETP